MTIIASGSSAVVTVTSGQQIAINSAPGVRCDIEATSGVPGSSTKTKVANHRGGYGIYGPFGVGTVTLFAIGGPIDYDAVDALRSADDTNVDPAQIYALVSGAGSFDATDIGTDWAGAPAALGIEATLTAGTTTTVLLEVKDKVGTVTTAATITADTLNEKLVNAPLLVGAAQYRLRRSSGTGTVSLLVQR